MNAIGSDRNDLWLQRASKLKVQCFSKEIALVRQLWTFVLLFLLSFLTACGGNGNSGSNSGGGGGGGGGGGNGGVGNQTVVSVAAGQAVQGVNITVPAPASSPTPNITAVGAHAGSAFSSGDVLHRNSSATVIVAGTGLNTSMRASLSGPGDITLGTLQPVSFKDGSTGVKFVATVSANAALGARTVILRDAKDDITTFAGSLQIVP